jgi:hypothetical protein
VVKKVKKAVLKTAVAKKAVATNAAPMKTA